MLVTKLEVFFDIVLYILICAVLYGALSKKELSRTRCVFGSFLILLFFIYAFWGGDYYHYKEGYYALKKNSYIEFSLEDVYYWIVSITPSYFFFRLIIWGGCFAFCAKIFSLNKIPSGLFLLSISAFALIRLSYARASLAMAIMYLGLAFIINEKNTHRTRSFLIGIGLIFASYFFHKSAYFGIVMIIFTVLFSFIKNRSVNIVLMVALFVSSFVLVRLYIGDLMTASIDPDESTLRLEVGQRYLGRDESLTGWGGRLRNIAEMIPYYWGLFIYIRLRIKGVFDRCSLPMLVFSNLFFVIVTVTTVFAFDFGYNTIFLYHRFMRFNLIPLSVFMAFCYMNGYERKLVKSNFNIGMLVALYTLAYSYLHVY